jgi:hypothetical protein
MRCGRCSMGGRRGSFGCGSSRFFRISGVQHQKAEERQNDGRQEKSGPHDVAKSKHFHFEEFLYSVPRLLNVLHFAVEERHF